MRSSLVALSLACALLAAAPPRAHAQAQVPAQMLAVPLEAHTLGNGLRVVLAPEHSDPTVAIAVYYDVGARVEEPGHTGFAHLFEHMMFQGSANVGKGEHFRLVAQHGGDFNGTTSEDRTNYYETLPANALELGLWLEADRMRSLAVTQENLDNQRATVLSERAESYENQPYALSQLRLDELAYGAYLPYAHSVIGERADLIRASLAEVRAFHDRYYAPNNAVLSIAGDFEPQAALALIERHFGAIPRRAVPPWSAPELTPQASERSARASDPLAELPAFRLGFHIPPRRTPDHYALELLAVVLGEGESSRLYQLLVKQREMVNTLEVQTLDRRGPDLFTVFAVCAARREPAAVRALVYQAIDEIARAGISGRELERARSRARALGIAAVLSHERRAQTLAEFELYDGNAALARTESDRYLAVTLEDIRRVAATYFTAANRTALDVFPAERP